MSASIDNGTASTEDSRERLSAWLDDYIAGRCDRSKMHEQFLEVCRSNPEAPWDALALLDQYQRRGRIDVGVVRSLKADIAQLVFGVATQTEELQEGEATVDTDTTGARWRKLYAERGEPDTDEAPIQHPVQRAFDPVTRPPPLAVERKPLASGAAASAKIGPGSVLRDRYELMEAIRSDRFGTVYQAFDRHRSHLPAPRCYVAIRVFELSQHDREAEIATLERQAYEAQSLSHPNIASVFDLDRHGETYFAVMEFIEGETLGDVLHRLAGRALSRERAIAVLSAVGAALVHAHRLGMVHGDLRPASIVLTTHGEVKVIDFGFARSRPVDQWAGSEPSIDGDADRTAAYASIERIDGDEPHPRDDVYSFACIAYEALSGRHPYGGRSAALARVHGRSPQKIAGLNPRQWQALELALKWNREERRIDVEQLLEALGMIEGGRAVPAVATSLENPFGRGKGLLLMMVLIVAAGAIGWWQWPRFIEADRASPVPAATEPDSTPSESSTDPSAIESTPNAPSAEGASKQASMPKIPSTGEIVTATAEEPSATQPEKSAPSEPRAHEPEGVAAHVPPTVEFDKDTYVATEDEGSVRLTIRRHGSTRNAVRFRWVLRPNSAEAGADYAAIGPGVEVIPPGSATATLTIPLVVDAVPENTELFLVELEALDDEVRIGARAHAAVIIVDDD